MGKIEFRYDENGNLISYKDGKPLGRVVGMGDLVKKEQDDEKKKKKDEKDK